MDPSEALARKLMEEEERLHRERMLAYAGVSLNTAETTQDHVMVEGEDIPPEDDDVADPDDMTYEELLQLGECVGRQATGMSGSQIKQFCTLKEFTRSGASGAKREGGDEGEEEEEGGERAAAAARGDKSAGDAPKRHAACSKYPFGHESSAFLIGDGCMRCGSDSGCGLLYTSPSPRDRQKARKPSSS